jgi:anthraniloyl-CoA monooxygenase
MNIACIGGGPAGLYFAILMKQADPLHDITVVERNRPDDTFGWGVVFSDATLGNFRQADPETHAEILRNFHHWDDIDVFFKGTKITSGGHGFCGIGRRKLLNILQARAAELGVKQVFETEITDDAAFSDATLIVAADGANSVLRRKYAEHFQPDIDVRKCRYIWLGSYQKLEAFTFAFE